MKRQKRQLYDQHNVKCTVCNDDFNLTEIVADHVTLGLKVTKPLWISTKGAK